MSHTHVRVCGALWSGPARTTGNCVEQVNEQLFIPAVSCGLSEQIQSKSVLPTHVQCTCALPPVWTEPSTKNTQICYQTA